MPRVLMAISLLVVLPVFAACLNVLSTSSDSQYLETAIPPCTPVEGSSVDPCEPDLSLRGTGLEAAVSGEVFSRDAPRTLRDHLDGSLSFIPHLVLRGTFLPGTVRCTSGTPHRFPSYEEPGYFQNSILIKCYADVRANDYILGTGPSELTLLVSFLHYWHGYFADSAANLGKTEEEFVEQLRSLYGSLLEEGSPEFDAGGIYGREMVLFIGPAQDLETEVWQAFRTWDVQMKQDGTVIAVHPERDAWRRARPDEYQTHLATLEMTLPAFGEAVTTANQARMAEYGGRVAPEDISGLKSGADLPMLLTDVHQLSQYYRDTGAYEHPDGPPKQPPPP